MKTKLQILLSTLLLSLTLTSQVPNYVPTNGLVGWWPFTGNANDLSANANNGTVTGAALTTDRFSNANSAYSFDGNGDYINCGNAPSVNLTGSITISAWIYATDLTNERGIVSKAPIPQAYSLFSTPPGTQIVSLGQYINFTVPTFTWVHVASVYNATAQQINIFLNGVSVSSLSVGFSTLSTSAENLYLGAHRPLFTPNWSWFGKLDEIGIWNRALNTCEINQLYSASLATINATTSNTLICVGESVTLTSTGATSYTWNPGGFNGSTIVLSPTTTTNYSVVSSNSITTCTSSTTVTQNVSPCTGISNNSLTQHVDLNIFPNPNNGEFTISSSSDINLTITNEIGQVIKAILLSEKNNHRISLTSLANGIYFVNGTDGKYIVKEKIIVNH